LRPGTVRTVVWLSLLRISDGSLVTLPAVPVTSDAYSVSTLSAYHGTLAILEALGFRLEGHVLLGDDDEGITPVDTATCWELAPYATSGVKD